MTVLMRSPAANDPISEAEAAMLFAALDAFPVLLLAVSGGPDSTALMWLAARWRDGLTRKPKLLAVTIDHGLRKESAREALAVKRLARKLKIEHRTLRWSGRKPKTGLQEAARNARYRLLAEVARKAGAERILLGHTLDDQAETVLIRLVRGSGVSGLAGMRQLAPVPAPGGKAASLVRPLLGVRKARLIATLKAAQVPYAEDPSNRNEDFTRVRLRATMPALSREGLTPERLAVLARRVERIEIALHDILNDALQSVAPGPWPGAGPVTMDMAAFARLPEEIGLRLLGRVIQWAGDEGPVELAKLEALCGSLAAPIDAALDGVNPRRFRRTLAGAMITLSGTKLTVERAPSRRTGAKPRQSGPKPLSPKTPFTKAR
jgi:tRNA(Ile)-lysidine synthase